MDDDENVVHDDSLDMDDEEMEGMHIDDEGLEKEEDSYDPDDRFH